MKQRRGIADNMFSVREDKDGKEISAADLLVCRVGVDGDRSCLDSRSDTRSRVFFAVACYIPASLLWMLLGPLLQRALPRSTKLFGIEERAPQISVILGGVCISALFLFLGQAMVASFGMVAILAGIDGVILSGEARHAIAI